MPYRRQNDKENSMINKECLSFVCVCGCVSLYTEDFSDHHNISLCIYVLGLVGTTSFQVTISRMGL
jgi:hypothetical protein